MRNTFPVALTDNRQNGSGDFSAQSWKGKASFDIRDQIIPARLSATQPTVLPYSLAGNTFYFTALTAALEVRPAGGSWILCAVGQGMRVRLENSWDKLEIRNTNAVAVTFSMFVGFDEFIDNTFSLNAATITAIASAITSVPSTTYGPVANSANNASGVLGSFRHFSFTLANGVVTFPGGLSFDFAVVGAVYFQWQGYGSVFPSPAFDASAGTVNIIGVQ